MSDIKIGQALTSYSWPEDKRVKVEWVGDTSFAGTVIFPGRPEDGVAKTFDTGSPQNRWQTWPKPKTYDFPFKVGDVVERHYPSGHASIRFTITSVNQPTDRHFNVDEAHGDGIVVGLDRHAIPWDVIVTNRMKVGA